MNDTYSKRDVIVAIEGKIHRMSSDSSEINEAFWLLGDGNHRRNNKKDLLLSRLNGLSDTDIEELARIFLNENFCLYRGQYYVYAEKSS